MEKIEYQLERIASALEAIADSISQTQKASPQESFDSSNENSPSDSTTSYDMITQPSNFLTHSPMTPEEELFIATTNIYLDETIRKHDENLKRKSGIIVSKNLILMQLAFLKRHLPGYDFYEHSGGVIIVSKDNRPMAVIRIYTDLGFHRGEHWSIDIKEIMKIASTLEIPEKNVFLIVVSNWNGLDNDYVCRTLGFDISNKEILEPANQNILNDFCKLYANTFSHLIPQPDRQIHFLCGSLHPNVVAEELYNSSNKNQLMDLKSHNWLSQPFIDIFSSIHNS